MRRFAWVIVPFAVAGCFGRTGIGDEELEAVGALDPDAGDSGSDVSLVDATTDGAVDTRPDARPDRYIDIWDVLPIPDGGPIGECAGCVRDKCGKLVNDCINSAECRAGLVCTLSRCLAGGGGGGGGGFDFKCINDCFKGDLKAAGMAISTFTCVVGQCGAKCGGFFGGLPGGGGGGGGGSGGGSGGSGFGFAPDRDLRSVPPEARIGFSIEAFTPWRREIQQEACAQGIASCDL